MKLLGIPKINNVHRDITFFVNGSVFIVPAKNYSLTELIAFLTALPDVSIINNKLFCANLVNFRFYNKNDRDYILALTGYTNYLSEINRDVNISIKGSAQYEINANFNIIVEYKIFNDRNQIVYEEFIVCDPFSSEFIREVTIDDGDFTVKFYNIYIQNEELNVINNIVLKSHTE